MSLHNIRRLHKQSSFKTLDNLTAVDYVFEAWAGVFVMKDNWKKSNWAYETSEDNTISVIASVSFGKFILTNKVTGAKKNIKYKCIAAGLSKGVPIGYSESSLENESSGSHVYCLGEFTDDIFPCSGYMIGVGGTLGVLDQKESSAPDPTFANGGSAGVVIFELIPFARFFCIGGFRATTPGLGLSLGIARFSLE